MREQLGGDTAKFRRITGMMDDRSAFAFAQGARPPAGFLGSIHDSPF